jgi:predicted nuclease with RNAse H fold
MRKADREMYRLGYPVFPPLFKTMQKLTSRAVKISEVLRVKDLEIIEVHPASSRKALSMPTKEWRKIQAVFRHIGLRGVHEKRMLTRHEIDAIIAALTGYLHLEGQTMLVGDPTEGFIVVPVKTDWRKLKI